MTYITSFFLFPNLSLPSSLQNILFSTNQTALINPVDKSNNPYFKYLYYLPCNCSLKSYIVLIAKNVPADRDKNIAYRTSPYKAIIHPKPIDNMFKIACPIIR